MMTTTFTSEDGVRAGEIVLCPRLEEFSADGSYVIVRERGEFLGAFPIDESTGLYEIHHRITQMMSADPEHVSHGQKVSASLVKTGDVVFLHNTWCAVDYWRHEADGAVRLNNVWFKRDERVLVHRDPEALRAARSAERRALYASLRSL